MYRGCPPSHIHCTMPELTWDGHCRVCNAPLDIVIYYDTDFEEYMITENADLKVFDLNHSIHKFMEPMKARRVCMACYNNYNIMKKHKTLRSIEMGSFPRTQKSMTQDEVHNWFMILKKSFNTIGKL